MVLVNHMLQYLPMYLLSAMSLPKGIIEQRHSLFAKLFCGRADGLKGKHWVKRKTLCLPREESGLGFRSLHDINSALFVKLWWTFRTSTPSLWSSYMCHKYYKKLHPTIV